MKQVHIVKKHQKFLAFIFFLFFVQIVIAQGVNKFVDIHGFGHVGYGQTDGNGYLVGIEDGSFDNYGMALNFSARPVQKIRINTQFEIIKGQGEGGGESELEVELDFGFVQWTISSALKFNFGKIKHPFGIYTEIFDVGTVRPFYSLPQGIYGPVGIISEGYSGVGLTGLKYFDDWGISYDLYFGDIDSEVESPFEEEPEGEAAAEEEEGGLKDVVGGRLIIETPLIGFSFGLSGYSGISAEERERSTILGGHLEYLTNVLSLRSEYAYFTAEEQEVNTYYFESGYKLTKHWEIAARYDWLDTKLEEDSEEVEETPSLLEHKEISFGLNYWLNQNFVLKLSLHNVNGNRFAVIDEESETEELDEKTNLIVFGAQFSF